MQIELALVALFEERRVGRISAEHFEQLVGDVDQRLVAAQQSPEGE